jgi:hypothetical protein
VVLSIYRRQSSESVIFRFCSCDKRYYRTISETGRGFVQQAHVIGCLEQARLWPCYRC